jgi:hypothetical protein
VRFTRDLVDPRRDACYHACSKDDERNIRQRVWVQDRAERIAWILPALQGQGTEIRPDFQNPRRIMYGVIVDAVPAEGNEQEYFFVVAEPEGKGVARFVTAFPGDHAYWVSFRRGGRPFYPPPDPSKPKKKGRK